MVTLNISLITKQKKKEKKTEQSDHVQIMRVFTENFRKLASFDCKASDPPVAARIVYLETIVQSLGYHAESKILYILVR